MCIHALNSWVKFTLNIYLQCKPVSSTSFKTNKLFAQITFWLQFSLITICHLFCSNILFAQTFKSVPMMFELTGFYCMSVHNEMSHFSTYLLLCQTSLKSEKGGPINFQFFVGLYSLGDAFTLFHSFMMFVLVFFFI